VKIAAGADHAGYAVKQAVVRRLRAQGHQVVDFGTDDGETSVDYPDIAEQVALSVLAHPDSRGVLVCGTGQGVAMAANGIVGIRAGVVADTYSAKMIRAHNDANVLCIGARVVGPGLARELLEAFLGTPFAGGRHAGRVQKLDALRRRTT